MNSNATQRVNSPIDCGTLNIIAFFVIGLFVVSFFANSLVLLVVLKHKNIQTNIDKMLTALIILNLFGTLTELPLVTVSLLKCK
jgi:hypothetical protein